MKKLAFEQILGLIKQVPSWKHSHIDWTYEGTLPNGISIRAREDEPTYPLVLFRGFTYTIGFFHNKTTLELYKKSGHFKNPIRDLFNRIKLKYETMKHSEENQERFNGNNLLKELL